VKEKLRRTWAVAHPFLLAIAPILFLYAYNMELASFTDTLLPMLVSLALALVAFLGLLLLLKDKYKAALLVSIFLVLFYSYGRAADFLNNQKLMLLIYGILLVCASLLVLLTKRSLVELNKGLTVFACALVLMSLFNMGYKKVTSKNENRRTNKVVVKAGNKTAASKLPDIYYIILDAYCRHDVLKDMYHYDNSSFVNFLKKKGFYVAEKSTCNYGWTTWSVSSELNMEYYPKEVFGLLPPLNRTKDNALARFLKKQGYKYVELSSCYEFICGLKGVDLTLSNKSDWQNEFTLNLIRSTALRLFKKTDIDASHRDTVLYQLATVPKVKKMIGGPRFVFVHIATPHVPYLFDRNGKAAVVKHTLDFTDKKAYLDQLIFVTAKAKTMISGLLAQYKGQQPPIVIVQSDHGNLAGIMSAKNHWDNPNQSRAALMESSANLNAILLPDKGKRQLYQSISSVNTFRVVLDCLFDAKYKLLEDRVFYIPRKPNNPYRMKDVTDIVRGNG
jgi:hypothetical protein